MTVRDDLARATEEARSQVREARAAVSSARQSRSGGAARNVRQAEAQLHELREAIADDLRMLKTRVSSADATTRRRTRTVAIVGAGALSAVVASGLVARSAVANRVHRRSVRRQAVELAAALTDQAARGVSDIAALRSARSSERRMGSTGLIVTLALGAAIGGAALIRRQQHAPIEPEDLWLPDHRGRPA
jgi:hypothetical protein